MLIVTGIWVVMEGVYDCKHRRCCHLGTLLAVPGGCIARCSPVCLTSDEDLIFGRGGARCSVLLPCRCADVCLGGPSAAEAGSLRRYVGEVGGEKGEAEMEGKEAGSLSRVPVSAGKRASKRGRAVHEIESTQG